MARQAICIGETVLDIIFKDDQPMRANPGGSTFNSSVSLGRAGINVSMVGETGADHTGEIVRKFLEDNGVDPSFMRVRTDMDTKVAMAFLDENNDASYTFLGKVHEGQEDFVHPRINADDVVLFGSFFALDPVNRPHIRKFLSDARDAGAIVYYDVNFRPSHAKELDVLVPSILENISGADIVRCSTDDLLTAFGTRDAEKVYGEIIAGRCRNFILTDGGGDIRLLSGDLRLTFPVEKVKTVSTIGAGDSFNAGIAYGLISGGLDRGAVLSGLDAGKWKYLIDTAQSFSRDCCQSADNYISKAFGGTLR